MGIKVLIIEDELPAQEHLVRQLTIVEPEIVILEKVESIAAAILWLKKYTADLIFMDIHLSDGLCFSIFDQIKIDIPVIFTTAYDAYAIKAFKVNSIDYLLKPIDEDDLRLSLTKYKALSEKRSELNIEILRAALSTPAKTYQERFIVYKGEKLLSITVNQIAYFEGEDRYVFLVKNDGTRFIIDYKLSDLEVVLDPSKFHRLNRSFITSFEAIRSMVILSKSRVKVELIPATKREVIVSSDNNQKYKKWLNL